MEITIRPAMEGDAAACARICYEAFGAIDERHGVARVFPSPEAALRRIAGAIAHPQIFGVVAEASDAVIHGFCFLSERDPVRAIGPIAVDPAAALPGLGRRLMAAVLRRAEGAPGIRLLQDTFNMRSLALYASLGFAAKELALVVTGRPRGAPLEGWEVRPMAAADLDACEALHARIHRYGRGNELRDSLAKGTPILALRAGRVAAYASAPCTWLANHAVALTDEAMQALLLGAAALSAEPLSFLMPVRQEALFRWCLAEGLRAVRPMTLMAIGDYPEPRGPFLPSVLY